MPDLKIRVVADSSGATAVLSGTAGQVNEMKAALDSAGESGVNAGAKIAEGGEAANYSMMEARHSVMLVGEELGVHMPRAVSSMIASIGPVGALMAAAFPILGAIALIEVIEKVVDHFQQAADAAAKFAIEEQDVQNKGELATQALEITNLKLQDEITKLEGGASKNTLQEQLLETNKAAGELAAGLDKDAAQAQKLLQGTSFVEKVEEWGKLFTDFTGKFADNYDKVDAALGKARDGLASLAGAEAEMDAMPSKENQQKYAQTILDTGAALTRTIDTLRTYGNENGANAEKIDFLTKKVTELNTTYKELGLTQQNAALQAKKATDEQAKTADAFAEEQISDAKRVADAWLQSSESGYKAQEDAQVAVGSARLAQLAEEEAQEKTFADQRLDIDKAAIQATLALHQSQSDADKKLREKLNADLEVAEATHQQALNTITANYEKQRNEEAKKDAEEQAKALEKLAKSTTELTSADEELAKAQGKLKEAQAKETEDAKVDAVKRQVAQGVITQAEGNKQLAALYQQDAQVKIGVEEALVSQLQAQEAAAQANLAAAIASGDQVRINQSQITLDKIKTQEANAASQILAINTQLQNQLSAIDLKGDQQREKALDQYITQSTNKFGQLFANIIQGHETITKAAVQAYNHMESAFVSYLVRALAQEIISHATHQALQMTEKMSAAETAAAKAGSAVADIPIIGPILAPIAAATVFAALSAFDTGGMVSGDQLALVHDHEAVLTPQQTETLKAAAEPGNGLGGGNSVVHNHNWNINALDGGSVKDFFSRHGSTIGDAIHHMARNGHIDAQALVRGK